MSQAKEAQLRRAIVKIGRELYDRGLVVATDGNLSARLDARRLLTTPSGLCKGWLREEQLIIVDMEGRRVDTASEANRHLKPTSEMAMHLEAYRQRPDVQAIVHAHPPHAIALSIAGLGFDDCFLPEALLFVGIPYVTPYATPSSPEGADAIRDAVAGHDVIVLQRHGSLALGTSLEEAYFRTESLEQLARIRQLVVQATGDASDVSALSPAEAAKLLEIRNGLGLLRKGDAADFCEHCGVCGAALVNATQGQGESGSVYASSGGATVENKAPSVDEATIRELVAKVIRSLDGGS